MNLPIDVIPGTHPPQFRWTQIVEAFGRPREIVPQEGLLPPSLEGAVAELIAMTKQLMRENAGLQGQVQGMADRIAAQFELLAKRAEPVEQPSTTTPKPTPRRRR